MISQDNNSLIVLSFYLFVSHFYLEYDSLKLMDNSGVFISIWIMLLLFVVFLIILRSLCKRTCCHKKSNRLLRCVIWGPILRTFIETFLDLGLCSYINIIFVILFNLRYLLTLCQILFHLLYL